MPQMIDYQLFAAFVICHLSFELGMKEFQGIKDAFASLIP
jgi:hypothetical protein